FVILAAAAAVGDSDFPRSFFLCFIPILYTTLWKCNARLPVLLAKWWFGMEQHTNVLMVGSAERISRLESWLEKKQALRFNPVGFVTDDSPREEKFDLGGVAARAEARYELAGTALRNGATSSAGCFPASYLPASRAAVDPECALDFPCLGGVTD